MNYLIFKNWKFIKGLSSFDANTNDQESAVNKSRDKRKGKRKPKGMGKG